MKTSYLSLVAAVAATVSMAASAVPSSTDEARAQAAQHNYAAEHEAALRPSLPLDSVRVTDTDSAREAAGQTNARQAHDAYLAELQRAGAGIKPAPIQVTDSDSARAAAGQKFHEQVLLGDYADLVKMHARAAVQPGDAAN
jgi:hypothetical protein